ncbi:unnamed protein product, partial [Musa acuminata var. zebrina]
ASIDQKVLCLKVLHGISNNAVGKLATQLERERLRRRREAPRMAVGRLVREQERRGGGEQRRRRQVQPAAAEEEAAPLCCGIGRAQLLRDDCSSVTSIVDFRSSTDCLID